MSLELNLSAYERALEQSRLNLDFSNIQFNEELHPRIHGKFAKAVGGLKGGQAITLKDGTSVHRSGSGIGKPFSVHSPATDVSNKPAKNLKPGDKIRVGSSVRHVTHVSNVPKSAAYGNPNGDHVDVHHEDPQTHGRSSTRIHNQGTLNTHRSFHSTASEAAKHALDVSAQTVHKDAVGGTDKLANFDAFKKIHAEQDKIDAKQDARLKAQGMGAGKAKRGDKGPVIGVADMNTAIRNIIRAGRDGSLAADTQIDEERFNAALTQARESVGVTAESLDLDFSGD